MTNLLPLQWKTDFDQESEPLVAGSEMPDPETQYFAPPAAYFFWKPGESGGWLKTNEEITQPFDLLDASDRPCPHDPVNGHRWNGTTPRQIQLRWLVDGQERRAWVPVIDEYGRLAATVLPSIDLEEAWSQLANFPMPPDEEALFPDPSTESNCSTAEQIESQSPTARYPVREMMQLIENIAAKQTSISKADWATWCIRLEHCLTQAKESRVLLKFRNLNLNPLSPLWQPPFRPDFADSNETDEGRSYESVIERVERAWDVGGLSKLEGDV